MDIILLLGPVILSTLIWPINRSVMKNNGRSEVYGFWISLFGAIAAGSVGILSGQSFAHPTLWILGLFIGISFSLGFCVIINYCLKIGPTGPTVTANNMGLVGPVIVSFIWPVSKPLTLIVLTGFLLVIISLVGYGAGAAIPSQAKSITSRWAGLVFLGWLFSVISMSGQYVGSVLLPENPLTLVAGFFIIATLILLPFVIRHGRNWFNRTELLGGVANGIIQAAGISITQIALRHISAQVVFPVTVLGPVIGVLILSAVVYKEKLNRLTWASCLIGLTGLALLAISR